MKLRMLTLCALAALTASPVMAADGGPIPIEDFVRHSQFSAAKISPGGEFLAITVEQDTQDVLAVLRLSDMSLVQRTSLPEGKSVGDFHWVGPKRLLFTATLKLGSFAQPFATGEWYAMDADGGHQRELVSYGGKDPTQMSKLISYRDSYSVLDPLPDDDKTVLMAVDHGTEAGSEQRVIALNTYSGQQRVLAAAPTHNCTIVLDAGRQPRFADCFDTRAEDGSYQEQTDLYRLGDDGKWTLLNQSKANGRRITVIGSAKDGRIYATADDRKSPVAFGTLDPATGQFALTFQDSVADPAQYIPASDGRSLLGVITRAAIPKVELLDKQSPDAAVYVSLAQAFPGRLVNFTSATRDGGQIVVSVSGDHDPTELYLYDRATGNARFLIRDREWLDGSRMAKVMPFAITTRDGVTEYGYLTVPNGREPKGLPMIVNPHGGPIGPRDDWGFNWEAQLLASRGYLVLQLNYRGSGGYGTAFQEMGHRQWGGKMQDDLTDATRWAIAQGYADPKRICIYGASYGGYAALMGAAKEPDLYRCAIGYVGVYDMPMMYKRGDIQESKSGRRFLERTLGSDPAELARISPINLADRIKVPVFLAAGMKDRRAPMQHSEAMRDALTAAGHPPEVFIEQAGEAHGFYSEANNLALYTKMLAFLDKYIGSGAP